MFEPMEETVHSDPLASTADVVGWYTPDIAALASAATACDPGSGPTRMDD